MKARKKYRKDIDLAVELSKVKGNKLLDANLIYDMGFEGMSGSPFKFGTQLFEINHLLKTAEIARDLLERQYTPDEGVQFTLRERGKTRFITSNTMQDKVVNHLICDHALMGSVQRNTVHDNGASQKGKGVSFHRRRLKQHLLQYFRKYGTKGYILLIDFSGFYANIPHDKCIAMLTGFIQKNKNLTESEKVLCLWLIRRIFKTFEIDVSRFSDEEIEKLMHSKVDPTMNFQVSPELLTGEKFLAKGVDIGNQISQAVGIAYGYEIDNFIKIINSVEGFGRYTDDLYIFHPDKNFLFNLLDGIERVAEKWGIIINRKKTRVCPIRRKFRHLQIDYILIETGKVVEKINPKAVIRERRKLKSYRGLLQSGKMTLNDIENSFKSWLGSFWKYLTTWQAINLGVLYYTLFGRKIKWRKKGTSRLRWLMEQSWKIYGSTGVTSFQM